jgi:Protein of unknown function (DUF2778)
MTFGAKRRTAYIDYELRRLPPNALPQRVLGGGAAVFVAALCAWTVCDFVGPAADRTDGSLRADAAAGRGDRLAMVSRRGDKLAVAKPHSPWSYYALLLDPHPSSPATASFVDARFVDDGSLQDNIRPVALTLSVPLPAENPIPALAPLRSDRAVKSAAALGPRPGSAAARLAGSRVATAESSPEKPSFFRGIFEKLFGKPAPTTLAYAATDDAGLGTAKNIGGRYDRHTAVYDISAHTVYMPDGTRLEAHSGLGSRLDDPSHPDERMHGVTPPNVYDLELREAPFHGVRALRMIPEDETKTFGRSGILAHTYMLGPNGDSNGCVSFRNYDAFLQAYLNHEIKRLAVVTRLD